MSMIKLLPLLFPLSVPHPPGLDYQPLWSTPRSSKQIKSRESKEPRGRKKQTGRLSSPFSVEPPCKMNVEIISSRQAEFPRPRADLRAEFYIDAREGENRAWPPTYVVWAARHFFVVACDDAMRRREERGRAGDQEKGRKREKSQDASVVAVIRETK